MIRIDGSLGEGGGQILRTALSLSLVNKLPFEINNIRAGRKKPGLLRQHLTAVKAAKEISNAQVEGDEMGSARLVFRPNEVKSGEYHFSVGTAGSATLVLQTVLPALMRMDTSTSIIIEGGTHNPYAPPVEFLRNTFLPILKKMGVNIDVELEKYGFYPAGGGRIKVLIKGCSRMKSVNLIDKGELKSVKAKAFISNLNEQIAQREIKTIQNKLPEVKDNVEIINIKDSQGPGNIVTIEVEHDNITETFAGFGEINKRAEKVATEAVDLARKYIASGAPVGRYLADQLMIPLALVGSSSYKTLPLSRHSQTNMEIIKMFCDVDIDVSKIDDSHYIVKFFK